MNWSIITNEWRLKLLAVGLAVLMLGAVAFSQNPPTTKTLSIPISYVKQPDGLILISPPARTNVTYSGLADVIANVNASNLIATVDLSRAHAGSAVIVTVAVSAPQGVTVQPPPPIALDVDNRQTKEVAVTVNSRPAPGWTITKNDAICGGQASSCVVHFDGPASWETNLQAYVDFPGQVNVSSINSANWQVKLQSSIGAIDLSSCHTEPCASLDVTTVSVHIEAVPGQTSSTVALLDSAPSHPPASGYRITGVTIAPNTVIISGDPVALGRIRTIVLPPIDLTGKTSDYTAQVQIPYPDGITGNVQLASVTYSISQNPNATPSP